MSSSSSRVALLRSQDSLQLTLDMKAGTSAHASHSDDDHHHEHDDREAAGLIYKGSTATPAHEPPCVFGGKGLAIGVQACLCCGLHLIPGPARMDIAVGFFAALCLLSSVLAWIDIRHGIIPNWLNLTIALFGLAKVTLLGGWHAALLAACTGVAIGVIVWLLRRLYFVLRGVQGLGLGDVKFLAAAGTWIAITELPTLLLVAAIAALAAVGIMRLSGRAMTRQTMIPFGPFLALGLLFTVAFELWSCC